MSVLEGADAFTGMAVPDFAVNDQYRGCGGFVGLKGPYAEKSADAVAAIVAQCEIRPCQTAPL